MKLHPLSIPFLVGIYALACSGKPPEPSEMPSGAAVPSAPTAEETATAAQAAETAPSASAAPAASATPEASAAPSSAPAEPAKSASPSTGTGKASSQTASGYAGDDPCQSKKFNYGQVKAACNSGGRAAVKGVMKSAVQKAKAAGQDLKCTSCHEDMSSFALKGNAVSDLKKWL